MYIPKAGMGARIAARKGPIWNFIYNKWYFDELYDATFVRAARWLGDLFCSQLLRPEAQGARSSKRGKPSSGSGSQGAA